MEPAQIQAFCEPLLAAMQQLKEKPRLGVPSSDPALHPRQFIANSRTAMGLRFQCSGTASDPVEAPNNGKTANQILQCASKLANTYSIAGILGLTNESASDGLGAKIGKTIGTAFLGNTFSGISDTVTHVATGKFGAGYVDVTLGGYAQGLALGPNAPAAAVGIVGAATNAGVDAALGEGMAGPVGWAKLGIDAAVYGSALLYCKSH